MKTPEKIVMFDSPEAAQKVEQVGWKSRDGIFYPGDIPSSERGARWSGCTHMTCECGNIYEKGRVRCKSCQAKIDTEEYYALPLVEWDGTTPVSDGDNKFWFDSDSLIDDMYWILEEAKKKNEEPELQLVLCKPEYLHLIGEDDWCEDLPEDGELPDEVMTAVDHLNCVIKQQGPVSWYPDAKRIDVDDLWKKLKEDLAKEAKEIDKSSEKWTKESD